MVIDLGVLMRESLLRFGFECARLCRFAHPSFISNHNSRAQIFHFRKKIKARPRAKSLAPCGAARDRPLRRSRPSLVPGASIVPEETSACSARRSDFPRREGASEERPLAAAAVAAAAAAAARPRRNKKVRRCRTRLPRRVCRRRWVARTITRSSMRLSTWRGEPRSVDPPLVDPALVPRTPTRGTARVAAHEADAPAGIPRVQLLLSNERDPTSAIGRRRTTDRPRANPPRPAPGTELTDPRTRPTHARRQQHQRRGGLGPRSGSREAQPQARRAAHGGEGVGPRS